MLGTFVFLVITVLCTIIWNLVISLRRPHNYPPGPKWIPWVGNTHQIQQLAKELGGSHLAYEHLSREYKSPVIGLKLGHDYVVVALGYEMVREIHTREEFQARPDNFFIRLRTMGTRLGITCTDGPLWSEHRSFTTRHLRQAGYARQPMELQVQTELMDLIDYIKSLKSKPTWPASFLAPSVINVLWTLATGKRIPRDDKRLSNLLTMLEKRSKAFDVAGGLLSQLPWLRFIIPEKSGYNLIQNFNMELHKMFMEIINEHKLNYCEENSADDLVYAYIKESKSREGRPDNTFTDVQLTMTILDIFIAGSQTTSNTLNIALMMMLVRPDIQDKIINEIDTHFPRPNVPKYQEKSLLPYVEAYLMEVQRFFSIAPTTGPRRALKTTTLGSYTVPENATILIGLRSVHMDAKHWGDPEVFRPERFLSEEGNIISNEYFMPFGQGKRRCLGDYLARTCLYTFFVGIMQNFRLKLPDNESVPSTNLLPGLTMSPKPYKVSFVPR
ncbi:unnamed protein product [Hermetia illucens]|uniref:Cytochrome P450 n=1 Tax=Hermetia illucens TaxID=343691 RepID=A0A7R8YPW7_HERIL|nr:probable cytochrome P450 305a1 [Hermetia illucens]CAD7080761.1 unnamed protein product [Hermetia illucens]